MKLGDIIFLRNKKRIFSSCKVGARLPRLHPQLIYHIFQIGCPDEVRTFCCDLVYLSMNFQDFLKVSIIQEENLKGKKKIFPPKERKTLWHLTCSSPGLLNGPYQTFLFPLPNSDPVISGQTESLFINSQTKNWGSK